MFPDFEVKWLNHIRKINDSPFKLGKVTYYKSFENKWCCDEFKESDKSLSFILGDKERVLYGPGFIKDTLCDVTFKISAKSFYQINPVQTEKLYNIAMDFANLRSDNVVIDAYSGIGTIGMVASKKAKKVICVENNQDAVKDARCNAKMNNINNVEFYLQDSTKFLNDLVISKAI